MRSAIESQVKAKMVVTSETRSFVDEATARGLKQMIARLAKDPSQAEAMGEALGKAVAAAWVKRYGSKVLKDTVKGASAVLDSI